MKLTTALLIAFLIPSFFFIQQPKKVAKVKKRTKHKVHRVDPLTYRVPTGSFETYAQGSFK